MEGGNVTSLKNSSPGHSTVWRMRPETHYCVFLDIPLHREETFKKGSIWFKVKEDIPLIGINPWNPAYKRD
jgi:hypothetical protein